MNDASVTSMITLELSLIVEMFGRWTLKLFTVHNLTLYINKSYVTCDEQPVVNIFLITLVIPRYLQYLHGKVLFG